MSTLRQDVEDYLATRRAMGFKVEGLSKLLRNFVSFCEARGALRVQDEIVLQWASTPIKVPVSDALFARRMDAVRVFARFQHALDPATQVPPERLRRQRYQPKEPNVFDEAQVIAMLRAADTLTPRFRAATWRTLIGLLATTGMRPGEACRLVLDDVDLATGLVRVVDTKFGKSRLVFLHPSTTTVLGHYLKIRADRVGNTAQACPALFVNSRGGALDPDRLGVTFKQIAAAAGIPVRSGHRPPRLYDLRHTFAVTTLLTWYRQGRDVQEAMPLLTTWLGHANPASTYWYLHAVPELLAHATDRLEARADATTTEPTS